MTTTKQPKRPKRQPTRAQVKRTNETYWKQKPQPAKKTVVKKAAKPRGRVTGVTLAKDALKWLKAGKFQAETGRYADIPHGTLYKPDWTGQDRDARTELLKRGKSCEVCQLGALAVAHVMRFDELTLLQVHNLHRRGIQTMLRPYISSKTLALMESAFEMSTYSATSSGYGYDMAIRATEFGEKYPDDKKRMRAIFQNYIKNRGKFIPPELGPEPKEAPDF